MGEKVNITNSGIEDRILHLDVYPERERHVASLLKVRLMGLVPLTQWHANGRDNVTPEQVEDFLRVAGSTRGKLAVILSAQLLHRDQMIAALQSLAPLRERALLIFYTCIAYQELMQHYPVVSELPLPTAHAYYDDEVAEHGYQSRGHLALLGILKKFLHPKDGDRVQKGV